MNQLLAIASASRTTKASASDATVIMRRIAAFVLLLVLMMLGAMPAGRALAAGGAPDLCPALAPSTGTTITVTTVSELESAVNNATAGDVILVADGVYNLDGIYLRIDTPDVTLRSASGHQDAVVLDGNYITTEIIQIIASNVTIADLTLREAYDHPIHIMSTADGDVTGTLIYNVHVIDPGQQAIKINPYASDAQHFPDDGVIACSHIELTDAGRAHIRDNCYTGGVDAHQALGWVIRDNLIEGFWCTSGLSEHGVHFWRGSRDTLVERNLLRNNARGVGFGLSTSGTGRAYDDNPCPGASGYVDHYGGVIRNNFIFANDNDLFASEYGFDSGIGLWNACGARALHNTVASTQAPFSSIEWRFDNTEVDIINNLVTHNLRDRGGTATLSGNLQNQPLSAFVDGAGGDLHLSAGASAAIDQVSAPADVSDDFDGEARPLGAASDVGADERNPDQLYFPVIFISARAASDVQLAWRIDQPWQAFHVHRGVSPYFEPQGAGLATLSALPWQWIDPGALGDAGENHYYLVQGEDNDAIISSQRVGEFDFSLVPGGN